MRHSQTVTQATGCAARRLALILRKHNVEQKQSVAQLTIITNIN